ncbi:MAG: hypothetical protein ABI378_12885, partial [Chitinophagaceae bacterium]
QTLQQAFTSTQLKPMVSAHQTACSLNTRKQIFLGSFLEGAARECRPFFIGDKQTITNIALSEKQVKSLGASKT